MKNKSNSELIEEAKLRYPIGTIFDNQNLIGNTGCRYIVTGHKFCSKHNSILIESTSSHIGGSYTIYNYKEWANIIINGMICPSVIQLDYEIF